MLHTFKTIDPQQRALIEAMLRQIKLLTTIIKFFVFSLFIAMAGSTVDSELRNGQNLWGPVAAWCFIIIIAAWLVRAAYRYIAKDKLWSAFSQSVANTERTTTLNEVLAREISNVEMHPNSLIASGASSVAAYSSQVFLIGKTPVTTAEVEAVYTITGQIFEFLMRDSLKLSLKLRVFSFRSSQYMPHIFITSRRNSRYKLKSRNMGLIDERLPKGLKFQELEGDFSRYFDIYSPDQKAVDILRIMTPDVMITLRDNGIDFDLELIDNRFYLYLEPAVVSPAQLELVLTQLDQLVESFTSELARTKFYDQSTGQYIPAKTTGFYGSIIAARFSLVAGSYLAFALSATLVGEAIASLYTGSFKIF